MNEPVPLLDHALRWSGAAVVLLLAVLANAVLRVAIRHLVRRAARRALAGRGRWTLRHPRLDDGGQAELRRLQRADAAAHMIARTASLLVLGVAVFVASTLVHIDPLVVLSSAGFVGAWLALAGQAVARDWLTGLVVLLEDRYAVGDRVTLQVGGETCTGAVETLSGVGLRLRLDDGTTWHTGHGAVDWVINHSQGLVDNQIAIPARVWDGLDQATIGHTVHAASHDLGLTDVVLASDIEAAPGRGPDGTTTVTVRASRALNPRQRALLADRIARSEPHPDRVTPSARS